eukprot:1613107-Rhodomonas_salina.1
MVLSTVLWGMEYGATGVVLKWGRVRSVVWYCCGVWPPGRPGCVVQTWGMVRRDVWYCCGVWCGADSGTDVGMVLRTGVVAGSAASVLERSHELLVPAMLSARLRSLMRYLMRYLLCYTKLFAISAMLCVCA